MDQQPTFPLIRTRFTAAIAVILTGCIAVLTLRSAFWQSPHRFHWLLPLEHLLPSWAVVAANLVLYASILWLGVALPLSLKGKERILAVTWILAVVLSPIQGIVTASLAAAIQYLKAASMMVGFVAALVIFVEGPRTDASSV